MPVFRNRSNYQDMISSPHREYRLMNSRESLPPLSCTQIPSPAFFFLLFISCVTALASGAHDANAGQVFARDLIPFMADSHSSTLGTITPGTPADTLDTSSGRYKVTIDGWSIQGAESLVFKAPGRRILRMQLEAAGQKARIVVEQRQDEFGDIWEHVRVTGWVHKQDVLPGVESVWKKADAVFHSHCSACHTIRRPDEFTANQWPRILKIMTERAALSRNDAALLTQYLQNHARDAESAN
jgi:hypothetical protein